ncbi:hypothetical protein F5X99DRAFT_59542 [Biscogniauxia marginata]|nr:hypothetical protein F5X99DRAFT_59542 [Biscogniauxia marginata]
MHGPYERGRGFCQVGQVAFRKQRRNLVNQCFKKTRYSYQTTRMISFCFDPTCIPTYIQFHLSLRYDVPLFILAIYLKGVCPNSTRYPPPLLCFCPCLSISPLVGVRAGEWRRGNWGDKKREREREREREKARYGHFPSGHAYPQIFAQTPHSMESGGGLLFFFFSATVLNYVCTCLAGWQPIMMMYVYMLLLPCLTLYYCLATAGGEWDPKSHGERRIRGEGGIVVDGGCGYLRQLPP